MNVIEDYVKQCVDGMIDIRGGISRQNAAGQLARYVAQYYEEINKRVEVDIAGNYYRAMTKKCKRWVADIARNKNNREQDCLTCLYSIGNKPPAGSWSEPACPGQKAAGKGG